MRGISILTPTRDRSHFLERLVKSVKDTVLNLSNVDICFLTIKDDQKSANEVNRLKLKYSDVNIKHSTAETGTGFNELWNIAQEKMGQRDILMLGADDLEFRSFEVDNRFNTHHWDEDILNLFDEYDDKIILPFFKDNIQAGRCPSHPFIHKKWYDCLGFFTCPRYKYWYADNFLHEVAYILSEKLAEKNKTDKSEDFKLMRHQIKSKSEFSNEKDLRVKYLSYKDINHLHWLVDQAPKDELYSKNLSLVDDKETELWNSYENKQYIKDCAEKLFQLIK